MAGLPFEVTDLAFNILSKLEQNDYNFLDASEQLKLSFNNIQKVDNTDLVSMSEEIKSININDISPLEALQKLAEIQKKLIKTK